MADITFGFVQSPDRVPIFYAREEGKGTPVVCADTMLYLHASQQIASRPDLAFNRALANGAPWYVFDWRGKGMSGSGPITRETLLSDLEAVLEHVGQCDLYAWGPATSLAVSAAITRPSLVRRLMLLGTVPAWSKSFYWSDLFRTLRNEPGAGMTNWLLSMLDDIDIPTARALAREWRARISTSTLDQYRAAMMEDNMGEVAAGCEVPVVVAAAGWYAAESGEATNLIPGAVMALLAGHRSGAKLGAELRHLWDTLAPAADTLPQRPGPASRLTAREIEVLRLLVEGLSNAAIGERLSITQPTAARHVANVFEKLCVHNRAEAVASAYRLGYAGSKPGGG